MLPVAKDSVHICIPAAPFCKEGIGFTCANIREPSRKIATHGWILEAKTYEEVPRFTWEFAALQASLIAQEYLGGCEQRTALSLIENFGRGFSFWFLVFQWQASRFSFWFSDGKLALESALASQLAEVCGILARTLPSPMPVEGQNRIGAV